MHFRPSPRSYSSRGGDELEAKQALYARLRADACGALDASWCRCSVGYELNKGAEYEQDAASICPVLHREHHAAELIARELHWKDQASIAEQVVVDARARLHSAEERAARDLAEAARDHRELADAGSALLRGEPGARERWEGLVSGKA